MKNAPSPSRSRPTCSSSTPPGTCGRSSTPHAEPERVRPGALIVAGDAAEPFLARVIDIVDGPGGRSIVHLDVVGVPDQAIDELRHARLLPQ